ncbi:hypothetical protein C8Q76DRAFT_761443 [Earliella scabrosa]|nr:hypothetical protein C8Q76DRAFT_761443 [Earliella scabrosa]
MSPAPSATLAYPPSAHSSSAQQSELTETQPAPVATMTASPALRTETGPAERIRGGCIPCPNGSICYIIPIPLCCC